MDFTPLLDMMSAELRLKYEQLVTVVEPKLQEKKVRLIIGLILTAILVAIGFFIGWLGAGEIKYDSLETPGAVSFARVWLSLTFVLSMIYFLWVTIQYKVYGTIAKSGLKTLDSLLSNEPDVDAAGLTAIYNEQTHVRVNNTLGTVFALLNMFTVLVVIGEVYRDGFRIFLLLLLVLLATGLVWMLDAWVSTHRWRETLERWAVYVYAAAIALLALSLLLTYVSPEAYSWFKANQYQGAVAIRTANQDTMDANSLKLKKLANRDLVKKGKITAEEAKARNEKIDEELKELNPDNPKSITERINDANPNPFLLSFINVVLLLIGLPFIIILAIKNSNPALFAVGLFTLGVLWLLANIFVPLVTNPPNFATGKTMVNQVASSDTGVCHRNYPSKSKRDDEEIDFAGSPISLPELGNGETLTLEYQSGEVVINNGVKAACWSAPVWGESWKKMTSPEYKAAYGGKEARFLNPNTGKDELINVSALYIQTTDASSKKQNHPFMESMGGTLTIKNETGGALKLKLMIQDPPENDPFRVGNMKISYKIEGGTVEGS